MTPEEYLAEKTVSILYDYQIGVVELVSGADALEAVRMARLEVGTEIRPKEVYLCVQLHGDGTFKMIVGCFYDRDRAERYADGSPSITIVKQSVL